MARFKVGNDLHPGIHRPGLRRYVVGDELFLPDSASTEDEVLPHKLIPLDEEAVAMLKASEKIYVKRNPGKKARPLKPLGGFKEKGRRTSSLKENRRLEAKGQLAPKPQKTKDLVDGKDTPNGDAVDDLKASLGGKDGKGVRESDK